jgi:hypothetical protein
MAYYCDIIKFLHTLVFTKPEQKAKLVNNLKIQLTATLI